MDRKKSDLVTLKRTTNRPDKESYNIQFDADYDYLFKIVIVGDSSVGKSVLMQRYVDNDYPIEPYVSTIGVDFRVKRLEVDNSNSDIKITMMNNSQKKDKIPNPLKVKLQVWDTAGQERFRSITQSYYRGMRLCILCFDSTKGGAPGSIFNVTKWLRDIRQHAGDNIYVYVIGTKIDSSDLKLMGPNPHQIDNEIQKIENYEGLNVKFMGWCSSKRNIFIDDLSDIDHMIKDTISNTYHWSSDRRLSNLIQKSSPTGEGEDEDKEIIENVSTISDMFEQIVFDYLRKESNLSQHTGIRLFDYTEDLDTERNRQASCCTIL